MTDDDDYEMTTVCEMGRKVLFFLFHFPIGCVFFFFSFLLLVLLPTHIDTWREAIGVALHSWYGDLAWTTF